MAAAAAGDVPVVNASSIRVERVDVDDGRVRNDPGIAAPAERRRHDATCRPTWSACGVAADAAVGDVAGYGDDRASTDVAGVPDERQFVQDGRTTLVGVGVTLAGDRVGRVTGAVFVEDVADVGVDGRDGQKAEPVGTLEVRALADLPRAVRVEVGGEHGELFAEEGGGGYPCDAVDGAERVGPQCPAVRPLRQIGLWLLFVMASRSCSHQTLA